MPERIANLRDVGGLATEDGSSVRLRRLLRSGTFAHHRAATAARLTDLLGVGDYVDLRTDREVDREGGPDALTAHGWRWSRHPLQDLDRPDPHAVSPTSDPDTFVGGHLRVAGSVAEQLIHGDQRRPVIVACSLGKDRTGIVIALLLQWLGVSVSTICEDFILSNYCLKHQRHLLPPRWRDSAHPVGRVEARSCADALARASDITPPTLTAEGLARLRSAMLKGFVAPHVDVDDR